MGFRITLIAFIIGLAFLLLILRQIKRTRINPAAAILWLCVAAFLLSISVVEGAYRWFAVNVIGIADARHVIYVVIIGFMMTYLFYLTSVITRMNDQIQNLISYLAIFERRLESTANGREDSASCQTDQDWGNES